MNKALVIEIRIPLPDAYLDEMTVGAKVQPIITELNNRLIEAGIEDFTVKVGPQHTRALRGEAGAARGPRERPATNGSGNAPRPAS